MTYAQRCVALLALAAGLTCMTAPARAALNVCNRTSYVISVATASLASTDIASQGWTRVVPGACRKVLNGDLTAPAYYLYARTSLAYAGPARAWGGDKAICVRDTNFTTQTRLVSRDCASDDFFQLPFAAVDTHRLRSWTATFSESSALTTLPQAQLAGLKRLLLGLGYKIAALDGRPDKTTNDALADVKTRFHLAPTASTDDLFDALETEALKTVTPAGYSICNDTAKAVAAALGERARNDWVSHGWWKIAAGSCAKVVDSLDGMDSVFLYVQKIGGPPLVSGPNKFCVADIEFDIQSRAHCAARGLSEAGFAETKVKGLSGFAAHIGDTGLVKPMPRHTTTSK